MEIYILNDVSEPSKLRSTVASEIRKNAHVINPKVFFMDSLKFFLCLYGHKLLVLCMDISSDGDLIVVGSANKNLKIWGLDFVDCHKSLFAHADSVMAGKFIRNTRYMFSVGKDRLVKYWDADKFELLLTLEGHHSEV